MTANVEKVCQMLVRRRIQSADAVKVMYQRWRKEPGRSDDAKAFVKWLVAKQYLTREQLNLFAKPAEDPRRAGAKTATRDVEIAETRKVEAIPLKEDEKPATRPKPDAPRADLPKIDVEPVALEELGFPALPRSQRTAGRELVMFLGGVSLGGILVGLIWLIVAFAM